MIVGKLSKFDMSMAHQPVNVLGSFEVLEMTMPRAYGTLTVECMIDDTLEVADLRHQELVILTREEFNKMLESRVNEIITVEE